MLGIGDQQPKSKCYLIWVLIWRLRGRICFQAYSGYWKNSFPHGGRTEVPISLLTLIWEPLPASQGCLHSLSSCTSTFKASNGRLRSSQASYLSDLLFYHLPPSSRWRKIRPGWILQNTLPSVKPITLVIPAKSLCHVMHHIHRWYDVIFRVHSVYCSG